MLQNDIRRFAEDADAAGGSADGRARLNGPGGWKVCRMRRGKLGVCVGPGGEWRTVNGHVFEGDVLVQIEFAVKRERGVRAVQIIEKLQHTLFGDGDVVCAQRTG